VIFPDETLFVECKSSKDIPFDPVSLLSSEEYRRALDLVGVYKKTFLLFFKEGRRMSAICVGGDIRHLVKYGLM
jgi:hypothetical protein